MAMNKAVKIALYVAGLHHLYHLFAQPWLNENFAELLASFPSFLLGSTFFVTLWVFTITWYFVSRKAKKK